MLVGPLQPLRAGKYAKHGNLEIRKVREWWRRGESNYVGTLITGNLLIFRDSQTAEISLSTPNWNVTGTSLFLRLC